MAVGDETIIVCMPKAMVLQPPVPAWTRWCGECGVEVWLSVTLLTRPGQLRCLVCHSMHSNNSEYAIVPEQEAEFRDLGLLEFSDKFVKWMNRRNHGRSS